LYRPVLQQEIPKITDPFDTEGYANQWWAEQWRRIKNGWVAPDGQYITGYQYFGINFVKAAIFDPVTGEPSGTPTDLYYFDDDRTLLFEPIWRNAGHGLIKQKRDLAVIKARDKHFSFVHMVCNLYDFVISGWNMMYATPEDKELDRYRTRLKVAYKFLPDELKGCDVSTEGNYKDKLMPDNEGEFGYPEIVDGKKITRNFIQFIPVGKKVQGNKVRGSRISRITIDEMGAFQPKFLAMLLGSAEKSMASGAKKVGHVIGGGTSDKVNSESEDFENYYKKMHPSVGDKIFIRGCDMYVGEDEKGVPFTNMKTGKTDKERATRDILKRREIAKQSGDKYKLSMIIQETPLYEEEIFTAGSESVYDEEKIRDAIHNIAVKELSSKLRRGDIEEVKDIEGVPTGELTWVDRPDGKCLVLNDYLLSRESENFKGLHVGGIDDYYKDKADFSDSKGCMIVYRRSHHNVKFGDMPILIYLDRPRARRLFVDYCKRITRFTQCMTLIELIGQNHGMANEYIEAGLDDYLLWVGDKPGIEVKERQIADMTLLCEKWFDAGLHMNVPFAILFEDGLKRWRVQGKNTDIGSAWHVVLVALDLMRFDAVEEERKRKNTAALAAAAAGKSSKDWMRLPFMRR